MMYTDDFKRCLTAAANVLYNTIQHEENLTVRAYVRAGKTSLLDGHGEAAEFTAENAILRSKLFDFNADDPNSIDPAIMTIANYIYMREVSVYFAD